MDVTFDPDKDAANIRKHGGISLAVAREADWDEAVYFPDNRFDYGEPRLCALVPAGDRLLHITFTETGENAMRVISARYAERNEVAYYVQHYR